jgi:hypothetical protein
MLIQGRATNATAPVVGDQSTTFGALTLSQRGDYEPINSGAAITSLTIDTVVSGTAGHFEANSGRVRVAAAGVGNLSGTYVLDCTATNAQGSDTFRLTIAIDANTYSVSPFNDGLTNVLTVSEATLAGKTIKLRPGDYTGSAVNHFNKHRYGSITTFTAHNQSDKPLLAGWSFAANSGTPGNCTLSYLEFFKSYATLSNNIVIVGNTNAAANVTIDHCEFRSDLVAARSGGTMSQFRFFIGIGKNGTDNIEITNCCFSYGCHAISFYGTNLTVTGCRQHHCWGDFINITTQSDAADTSDILIENNCQHDYISDVNDVHPDFIQCFAFNEAVAGEINNLTVRGNVVFPGYEGMNATSPATGTAMQGMLMQTAGATVTYSDHTVEGNVFCLNTLHGISYEGELFGTCLIRNNTLYRPWPSVQDEAHGFQNYATPTIRLNIDGTATVTIENNAAEDIVLVTGSATQTNNNTGLSRSNISTYTARLQGTTFNPTTRDECLADARIKVGGALETATPDIGAVGTTTANGFYDFTAFIDPCG